MKIETNHTVILSQEEVRKLLYSPLEEKLSEENVALPINFSFFWENDSKAAIITWVEKEG